MAITSTVFANILKISFPQKAHPISLAIKLMGLRINLLLWIMHHMRSYIGWVWVPSLSGINSAQGTVPTHSAEPSSVTLSFMCYSRRHQARLFHQNIIQEAAGHEYFTQVRLIAAVIFSFLLFEVPQSAFSLPCPGCWDMQGNTPSVSSQMASLPCPWVKQFLTACF